MVGRKEELVETSSKKKKMKEVNRSSPENLVATIKINFLERKQ